MPLLAPDCEVLGLATGPAPPAPSRGAAPGDRFLAVASRLSTAPLRFAVPSRALRSRVMLRSRRVSVAAPAVPFLPPLGLVTGPDSPSPTRGAAPGDPLLVVVWAQLGAASASPSAVAAAIAFNLWFMVPSS